MDGMEDSGFDSDQKSSQALNTDSAANRNTFSQQNGVQSSQKKTLDLQKKINKHRAASKNRVVNQQPKKYLLSRNRLSVPSKQDLLANEHDNQPLVAIVSDDSEDDDFESPMFAKAATKEIAQQLIKDGYNLDLEPDDEDLDLIPPRPLNERCICCPNYQGSCVMQ
ncbi:protein FAM219A-like [Mytilus galloprovincialis]|uniref:protein FAM219A-like n=1 Tax=Mytilus galloprovincialis TaxID=29158 RepID=UPI003F7C4CE2